MLACGLDFGTSNSAIGVMRDGALKLAPVERDASLIPSAVFFESEANGRVLFGSEAIDAYVGQSQGRLMRALKSILGSALIDETTLLGKRRISFARVIEIFVRHMKRKAEEFLGEEIGSVVHGRPVRFVEGDDAADARAEAALEQIARRAGFREIAFVYEPIAAAYHYEATIAGEELVLIADIGGGTSDFTIIRLGPQRITRPDRTADILANTGARIGGTDLDALLSLDAVMPLLGLGTHLIEKDLPMPRRLYYELAAWATINFAYTYKNEREVRELVNGAREPEKVSRLEKTIRGRLGHRLAFAVEDAKIGLSSADDSSIALGFIEDGLGAEVSRRRFDELIGRETDRLTKTAAACIADAGLRPQAIETIFVTGGSSRVPALRQAIARVAPSARMASGSDMLSVALGLTREAARRFA